MVSIVVVGDAKQLVLADIRAIGTNTIDIYPGKDFGDDEPQNQQALKYYQPRFKSSRVNSRHACCFPQNLRLRYNTRRGVSANRR